MKMTSDKRPQDMGDDPLGVFFDAARADAPGLSPALRGRILDDAAAAAPEPVASARPAPPGRLRGWISGWAASFVAGGAMAAMAGLWVGIVMPLPVVALDVPLWMHEAFSYLDAVALPLIGLDDPLVTGF